MKNELNLLSKGIMFLFLGGLAFACTTAKPCPEDPEACGPEDSCLVNPALCQPCDTCSTADTCDVTAVSFSTEIQPVLTAKCGPCHTSSSAGGVSLSSHSGVKGAATSGLLVPAIESGSMPPAGGDTLTACELEKLKAWIADGSPNN